MAKDHKARFVPGGAPQLNNPFAGLHSDGLPPGPAAPAPPAAAPAARLPKPGRVVLRRETAHRAGKVVIVIDDFAPHIGLAAIEELGRRLRQCLRLLRRRPSARHRTSGQSDRQNPRLPRSGGVSSGGS